MPNEGDAMSTPVQLVKCHAVMISEKGFAGCRYFAFFLGARTKSEPKSKTMPGKRETEIVLRWAAIGKDAADDVSR